MIWQDWVEIPKSFPCGLDIALPPSNVVSTSEGSHVVRSPDPPIINELPTSGCPGDDELGVLRCLRRGLLDTMDQGAATLGQDTMNLDGFS